MLMIRFQRIGRTNDPAFRIVVLEKERAAQAGNIVEQLGTYNPKSKAVTLKAEAIKEWIAKGAQPTDSMRNLLISQGILEGKKVNVLPQKTPVKKEQASAAEETSAAGAEPETVVEPTEAEAIPAQIEDASQVPEEPVAAAQTETDTTLEGETEKAPVA